MILAIDNTIVEVEMYKGNSSSEKLFDLVVHLRQADLKFSTKLLLTHLAGTRMIEQGPDRVSRGSPEEGMAAGKDMIKFCPWGKSAIEAESKLKLWIIT